RPGPLSGGALLAGRPGFWPTADRYFSGPWPPLCARPHCLHPADSPVPGWQARRRPPHRPAPGLPPRERPHWAPSDTGLASAPLPRRVVLSSPEWHRFAPGRLLLALAPAGPAE